ncbi:aspartate kinase [Streptomyces sp. H27-S2]|uniref:amino acid kinase family protein n=1 Tax=Streptomyces antarcticus TaxID=2996458 RepID=UPI00226E5A57|nr:aspartate kinase [Streptomyces sp. H27-S2]MCY0954274.1 aspartate kinase [Streptomyces sp. H27-S2]
MKTPVVLKFGGSTFRTPGGYEDLARGLDERIRREPGPMAVVVSAMQGETEGLRGRLHEVNRQPGAATAAGLLTTADLVSAHLLATALHRRGRTATVLAGHQLGLTTNASFLWARVVDTDPAPLRRALARYEVVVVPGGQAVDGEGRPTWLGKNSSDLSALAVARAVGSRVCEIHSDVDGIYTSDPHLVSGTRMLPEVSYNMAALMSLYGAKVLHRRAVQLALRHRIEIVLRHNRAPYKTGTTISGTGTQMAAVVFNQRSLVLDYRDDAHADSAHHAFHLEGLDTVRLNRRPSVAVVGGYVDTEAVQRKHGVKAGSPAGVPVAEVRGSKVTTHVAQGSEDALRLAQRLHDGLDFPVPGRTGVRVGV